MTTIVRTWMAYARPEKVRACRNHVAAVVLAELRKRPACLRIELCEAARGDRPRAEAVLEEYDNFLAPYDVTFEVAGA